MNIRLFDSLQEIVLWHCALSLLFVGLPGLVHAEICPPGPYEPSNRNGYIYSPVVDKCISGKVIMLNQELCFPGDYYSLPSGLPLAYNPAVEKCTKGYVYDKPMEICAKWIGGGYLYPTYNPDYQYCDLGIVKPLTAESFAAMEERLKAAPPEVASPPPAEVIRNNDFFPPPESILRPLYSPVGRTISDNKVSADDTLTLGQMARLVNYSYVTESDIEISTETIHKLEFVSKQYEQRSYQPQNTKTLSQRIAMGARDAENKRLNRLNREINAKRIFLSELGLRPVALSETQRKIFSETTKIREHFGVEIYQLESTEKFFITIRAGRDTVDLVKLLWKDSIPETAIENQLYQPAFLLAEDFIHTNPGAQVTVLGHGVGGSMAQSIAVRSGVRAVVFNSYPVPTWIADKATGDLKKNIIEYSAVYPFVSKKISYIPDPISIKYNDPVDIALDNFRYLRRHINRPRCVFIEPDPWLNEEETEYLSLTQGAVGVVFSPALLDPKQAAELALFWGGAHALAKKISEDSIWSSPAGNAPVKSVKLNGEHQLHDDATRKALAAAGFVGSMHVAWDIKNGRFVKAGKTVAIKAGIKSGLALYKRTIMAHSMDRFVRGLYSTDAGAENLYFDGKLSLDDWRLQCGFHPQNIYPKNMY